jgi:hypothetical protein
MIARAIERNVPKERIAKALDINLRSVERKMRLLDGICSEAVNLLKDKSCPMAIFDVLRDEPYSADRGRRATDQRK